ncbi:MAG: tetratricopeptide repeat protein [Pyrinomonadaceae bacterium]
MPLSLEGLEVQHYQFDKFILIPEERLLFFEEEVITLPPKIFDVLVLLVKNFGHLVEKADFLDEVWSESFVEEATLARTISQIRKTLGEYSDQQFIETVPKCGYRFVVPVEHIYKEEFPEPSPILFDSNPENEKNRNFPEPSEKAAISEESEVSAPKSPPPRQIPRGRLFVSALISVSFSILIFIGFWSWQTKKTHKIESIAILPFQRIDEGESDEALEFGMADALVTKLSNLEEIAVRPMSSVFKYSKQDVDPLAIGKELKVDAVLEGKIQRNGDRVRVSVQLIKTSDNSTPWAEKFDTDFRDIFSIQDSISQQVAKALARELSGEELKLVSKHPTNNAEAYQLYMEARYLWNKRTVQDLNKSIEHFEQAIKLDPNYALAYTGLADTYQLLAEYEAMTPGEGFAKARKAVGKALEIDDQLAEAHTSLAYILAFYDWDFVNAEKEFNRALKLDPNYATAHQWFGEFLLARGRFEEARTEHIKALELDPTSLIIQTDLAAYYYTTRDYDKAIEQSNKVIELNPGFAYGYVFRGFSLRKKGLKKEGAEDYTKAVELFGEKEAAEELRAVLQQNGHKTMWLKRIEQVNDPDREQTFSAMWRCLIYVWAEDKENALFWLEKAYERRDRWFINMKYAPDMDFLRSEPQYQNLMRRIE